MADLQVGIVDSGDLKRLAKDLRQHADGKALRKELTGGMRDALRPLIPQVRAAYLAAPSGGSPKSRSRATQPDLRVLLAKSVRLEVRTAGKLAGARIRADGRRMPNRMKSLPAYWEPERSRRRWRHPVFGNREVWVQQPAPGPTFYRVLAPHADDTARVIERVVNDVRRKLERG